MRRAAAIPALILRIREAIESLLTCPLISIRIVRSVYPKTIVQEVFHRCKTQAIAKTVKPNGAHEAVPFSVGKSEKLNSMRPGKFNRAQILC
jgi:hypothetical protein